MNRILCIDIGGTRIKSAILWDNMDLDSLKDTKIEIIRSLGWLNSSLPQIISKTHPYSLVNKNSNLGNYNSISLSVPAKIINSDMEILGHHIEKRGLPKNLKKSIEDEANCEVFICNDAVCWLSGSISYCSLCSISIDFPCLLITLGTGVGAAFSKHINHIEDLEISNVHGRFPQLSKASNQVIDTGWKVHACLGEKYFNWVKNEQKHWTYLKIQEDYNNKVLSFLLDIKQKNLADFESIKTIFIGGGNADYLNNDVLSSSLNKNVYVLSSSNLQINPDVIPLLGLTKLAPIENTP